MSRSLFFVNLATILHLSITSCGVLVGNPDEKDDDQGAGKKARVIAPQDSFEPQSSSGLFIHLMDAPVDDARAVHIKIAGVEARHEDLGWRSLNLAGNEVINLLELQDGKTMAIVDGDAAPAGRYDELRLILAEDYESNMMLSDGTLVPLSTPSADKAGLKLKTSFEVSLDGATELVIDFDLRQSIKQTGKSFRLSPVLKVVNKPDSGFLVGSAAKGSIACLYPEDAQPDASADCPLAVRTTTVRGEKTFTFAFVPVGTYVLRVFEGETIHDYSSVVVVGRETTRVD